MVTLTTANIGSYATGGIPGTGPVSWNNLNRLVYFPGNSSQLYLCGYNSVDEGQPSGITNVIIGTGGSLITSLRGAQKHYLSGWYIQIK